MLFLYVVIFAETGIVAWLSLEDYVIFVEKCLILHQCLRCYFSFLVPGEEQNFSQM
jgi:hypothetical protein